MRSVPGSGGARPKLEALISRNLVQHSGDLSCWMSARNISPSSRIFSHPNVLPVLGACQSPPAPHPTLITHWMPYGSLYNVLHEGTSEYGVPNLTVAECPVAADAINVFSALSIDFKAAALSCRVLLQKVHKPD